jgi:hypothetical protein
MGQRRILVIGLRLNEAPTPLASVRARRAVLGTGKIPAELLAMKRTRALYLETDSNKKPQVQIDSVESRGQHLWKVAVPVGEQLKGARPGLTLERHPSAKFLEEAKEVVSFQSHRPDWIDALTVPRLALERAARSMRRFDGRRVEPLWVYDNAWFPSRTARDHGVSLGASSMTRAGAVPAL